MIDHLLEFVGRTHLVLLHFPIAFIVVAAMMEVLRAVGPRFKGEECKEPYRPSSGGTMLFFFGLLGTVVSVATGLVLGFDGGERVDLHRILGIVSGVLVLGTGIALMRAMGSETRGGRVYLVLLCVSAGAVGATGHFGGELTHGEGFLTNPLKRMVGIEEVVVETDAQALGISQESVDVFRTSVLPILEQSCIECHGPEDAEEDIRLDAVGFVLDRRYQTVRRGDPKNSEIVYRIELPHGDPDIMPPEEDGEPLTREQIDVISAWIELLGK